MATIVQSKHWKDDGHIESVWLYDGKAVPVARIRELAHATEGDLMLRAVNTNRMALACRLVRCEGQKVRLDVLVQDEPCELVIKCTPYEYSCIQKRVEDDKTLLWALLYADY